MSDACPCVYGDPCHENCTCVQPYSSRGCDRCCSYGSDEQRAAKAKRLIPSRQFVEKEKEIIECMFGAWTKGGMPLYGNISIQAALDLMISLGIDTKEAEEYLDGIEKRYKRVIEDDRKS